MANVSTDCSPWAEPAERLGRWRGHSYFAIANQTIPAARHYERTQPDVGIFKLLAFVDFRTQEVTQEEYYAEVLVLPQYKDDWARVGRLWQSPSASAKPNCWFEIEWRPAKTLFLLFQVPQPTKNLVCSESRTNLRLDEYDFRELELTYAAHAARFGFLYGTFPYEAAGGD